MPATGTEASSETEIVTVLPGSPVAEPMMIVAPTGSEVFVAVAVEKAVGVGPVAVGVAVAPDVLVTVLVAPPVAVLVAAPVAVLVAPPVAVLVAAPVAVWVGVTVTPDGVLVDVGVFAGVSGVCVAVLVATPVIVAVAVPVGVPVGV